MAYTTPVVLSGALAAIGIVLWCNLCPVLLPSIAVGSLAYFIGCAASAVISIALYFVLMNTVVSLVDRLKDIIKKER